MKTLEDISGFLRNALSHSAYNYDDLDSALNLSPGTIVRILDATGDYSAAELMMVLDKFGLEIDIFDQIELKKMKGRGREPAPEPRVRTKVMIAVERIREQSTSPMED